MWFVCFDMNHAIGNLGDICYWDIDSSRRYFDRHAWPLPARMTRFRRRFMAPAARMTRRHVRKLLNREVYQDCDHTFFVPAVGKPGRALVLEGYEPKLVS